MQATRVDEFSPFKISITVETEEEAKALYAIFNHQKNITILPAGAAAAIRIAIKADFYVADGVIANGITYDQFYS